MHADTRQAVVDALFFDATDLYAGEAFKVTQKALRMVLADRSNRVPMVRVSSAGAKRCEVQETDGGLMVLAPEKATPLFHPSDAPISDPAQTARDERRGLVAGLIGGRLTSQDTLCVLLHVLTRPRVWT